MPIITTEQIGDFGEWLAVLTSMTTAYNLREEEIKITLYKEVMAFWKINKPFLQNTRFKDA